MSEYACAICKRSLQAENVEILGTNEEIITCPRCGPYHLLGVAGMWLKTFSKADEALLSGWVQEQKLAGRPIPLLTQDDIQTVLDTVPRYSALEKQRKLISALEIKTEVPGALIELFDDYAMSLAWAENPHEYRYSLSSLEERGLLKRETGAALSTIKVQITPKGWEYLESHAESRLNKVQAFVAMSFAKEFDSLYMEGMRPAIRKAGYNDYRVGIIPDTEKIDNKIIAEIKNSRFMVADVTDARPNVHYEAGFAQGLGVPVIWCIRESDLMQHKLHFDTRQFPHIPWKNPKHLEEQLYDTIRAVIGEGPLKFDQR